MSALTDSIDIEVCAGCGSAYPMGDLEDGSCENCGGTELVLYRRMDEVPAGQSGQVQP